MFNEIFNNLIKINQVFDKDKKVVIFGAGLGGKTTFFVLKKLSISPVCFVDNDPSLTGSKLFGIPIEAPSSLFNEAKEDLIILIASVYYDEISFQLINMGFEENINYFGLLTPKKISVLKETTFFPEVGFSVGKYSYGYQQFCGLVSKYKMLKSIGSFCSIAQNVSIAVSNHPLDCISTHPFFYGKRWGLVEENFSHVVKDTEKNRPVVIGNDVWIGTNVTILPSVEIGDGAGDPVPVFRGRD
jgi:acetyltransferase-like isoleucine patch superfamily enzyme